MAINYQQKKNTDTVFGGSNGIVIPNGTTSGTGPRPGSPSLGDLRYNLTLGLPEFYTAVGWQAVDAPPTVSNISGVLDASVSTTITITGTNFKNGSIVSIEGTAVGGISRPLATTYVSSTQLTAATNSTSVNYTGATNFDVKVLNPSGLSGLLSNAGTVDRPPVWTTSAGSLGTFGGGASVSTSVVASDPDGGSLTYAITSGTLSGSGLSLSSGGAITGTATSVSSQTTYSFDVTVTSNTITAVRSFSLILQPVPAVNTVFSFINNSGTTTRQLRGASGGGQRNGPSQGQVNSAYSSDQFRNGRVTVQSNGFQNWNLNFGGLLTITCVGGCGGRQGTETGGAGASLTTTLRVYSGDVLCIAVGQGGDNSNPLADDNDGGGGGASGVFLRGRDPGGANGQVPSWDSGYTYYPVLVAGGGGAASSDAFGLGAVYNSRSMTWGSPSATSGAGNGAGVNTGSAGGRPGASFVNGGQGGAPASFNAYGGFGAMGGGGAQDEDGAGGGGWVGGICGDNNGASGSSQGGTSFCYTGDGGGTSLGWDNGGLGNQTPQNSGAGTNSSLDGYVTITYTGA